MWRSGYSIGGSRWRRSSDGRRFWSGWQGSQDPHARGGGRPSTGDLAGLTGDPSLEHCGFEVIAQPDSPTDPCIEGASPLVAATYVRAGGAPIEEQATFDLSGDAAICVRASTNVTGFPPANNVSIALDSAELFSSQYFGNSPVTNQARRSVGVGTHEVTTTVNGQPGTAVHVEVLSSGVLLHAPVTGTVQRLVASDLRNDPEIFSPNGNGIRDTTTFSIATDLLPPVSGSGGSNTYRFDAAWEITSGDGCQPTRTLTASASVPKPGATRVAATWDGTDDVGVTVPDGIYYYRALVSVYRLTPGGVAHLLDTASTGIQALVVTSDDTPPVLLANIENDPEVFGDTFRVAGGAFDAESGIQSVVVSHSAGSSEAPPNGDGFFELTIPLTTPGPEESSAVTFVEITASDTVGNSATVIGVVRAHADHLLGHLLVRPAVGRARDAQDAIEAAGGTVVDHAGGAINTYLATFASDAAATSAAFTLAADPAIASVDRDAAGLPGREPADPWWDTGFQSTLDQENLKLIGMTTAWEVSVGSRTITVAVWDTGVDIDHPELADNIFLNPGELPVPGTPGVTTVLVDDNGDGVITLSDLNASVNEGKVPGVDQPMKPRDLVDGNIETDVALEGDLNGDGCPGVCGIDDDFDGGADFRDPDICRPFLDFDRDGDSIAGPDDVCGTADDDPDDIALAAKDDDENGYPDDIAGWDVGRDGDDPASGYSDDNDPFDFGFHGTAVAGVIGAVENDQGPIHGDVSIAGINWEVRILPVRIVDPENLSGVSFYSEAARYTSSLARVPEDNLRAINLSFQGAITPGTPQELFFASELDNAGVLAVLIAGNQGVNLDAPGNPRVIFPGSASNPNVISVAACDDDGDMVGGWFFDTNYGSEQIEICAPGNSDGLLDPYVITTFPRDDVGVVAYRSFGLPQIRFLQGYSTFYGTSAAAPHVAGVLGLMQAANPGLPHSSLKQLLLETVDTSDVVIFPNPVIYGKLPVNTQGHLEASTAVAAALVETPPVPLGPPNSEGFPAVSGDGNVVAFVSNRITTSNPEGLPRVWVSGSDGSFLQELPAFEEFIMSEPSLSEDGRVVAFTVDFQGDTDVWVARLGPDLEIETLARRTFASDNERNPVVSADGEWIAFASQFDVSGDDTLGDWEIFRITTNEDAGDGLVVDQIDMVAQVTRHHSDDYSAADIEMVDDRRPSISEDGRIVAWVTLVGSAAGIELTMDALNVAVYDSDLDADPGVGQSNPVDARKTAVSLVADPEGSGELRVAFGLTSLGSTPSAFTVALDGSDLREMTAGLFALGFSANGQYVAKIVSLPGSQMQRVDLGTGDLLDLRVFEPDNFPEHPDPPDLLITACDVMAQVMQANASDRQSAVCRVALSADGTVAVFIAAPKVEVIGPTRPRDLYVFRQTSPTSGTISSIGLP